MTTTGGQAPLRYNFTIYNQDGAPVHVGAQSTNASIKYTPTAPGYYVAVGVVRDVQGTTATKEGAIVRVDSVSQPIIQAVAADKATAQVGEKLTWTMTTTGGVAPLRYNFTIYNQDGAAVKVGAQSTNASIEYTPTALGYYVAVGVVRDAQGASALMEG